MKIKVLTTSITETPCDILLIHLLEGAITLSEEATVIDQALSDHLSTLISQQPHCSNYGEVTIIHTWGAISAKRVMLIGMGKESELTLDKIRALSGSAMRAAQKLRAKSVATMMPVLDGKQYDVQTIAQGMIEGALLGTYQFNYYKTTAPTSDVIQELFIIENNIEKASIISQSVEEGKIIGESVNVARDLVNHPSKYMTPTQLTLEAQKIAKQHHLEINILEKEDMENEQMHALLAVAQGSAQAPKMIVLKYIGDKDNHQMTAFVGKGVTFDSGGISIKPSLNMGEMKGDMAGGATVLGTMLAIGQLKPKVNILAIIPCTENMPSGHAYKPGDVISSMNGKTIEIITTDAEGRLILADAITYAQKLGATQIVDVATLTGACVIALGNVASGLITNHAAFCKEVSHAAKQTGEKMWELPNFDEYKEQIKSDIADLKNSGGRMAGAITAGLFIEAFVNEIPWVHIDIAGTSDGDKESGYIVKGGTGVGVRTLIQLAQNMSAC
ncbi:leucyl aminopeptidase [Pelosinus sp. sgz500959]|uniref:leucyl aminopeptidase n=1 Tax=Pelosinus sp. sgz500959 TaxID=3242472 RepID=UPI003672A171